MRAGLAAAVERLRSLAPGVSWVARDNVHITLKFLGNVERERLGAIEAALGVAASATAAFDLTIESLGAFPSRTRPRVLWAGVGAGAAQLTALAARVDDQLAAAGLPRETRPFAAHATLGRVREPHANPHLAEALGVPRSFGRQRVTAIALMRSELSPRGARYTALASPPLRPAG